MRLFVLIALTVAAIAPARANLVTNPGFETCATFSAPDSWTLLPTVLNCDHNPHTGVFNASLSGSGSGITMSQTITTVAGQSYDFSFWLGTALLWSNAFTASFDGVTVLSLTDAQSPPYAFKDFTVTAGGTSTVISFTGFTVGDAWIIDDVSVTEVTPSATPEPASLTLLGGGLIGLWWIRRRARGAHGVIPNF